MFIQVIEGKTSDPDALHRQLAIWERDLKPGAVGYLGSTAGCTSDGDCIMVARFESPEAARVNSQRAEQTRWWHATERCFDGPVRFHDSVEVEVMDHGPLGKARFVQVMDGHVTDRARAIELEREADPILADARPDLLGSITVYYDDNEFTELAYFVDENAAREGEQVPVPQEFQSKFAEWQEVLNVDRYLDIREPWFVDA